MYIESIELDNFKSFGEKVFIPFFPGFTTISGPNGSGKSNVIDSLLFTFGLSTNKTMRAERLTDLMNNLSGKSQTQVTVTLYDEINETQLQIARRIRLKNSGQYESSYLLNSKVVTLSEIHDQLTIKNISANAYNIVMQGDVTRIISMSPLERRRIIDELAGVAEFDRKIEDAKLEIAQAEDSLEKQAILLSEFSERLEILKKERDQALKYGEFKNKRNFLERLFRQTRIKELEERKNKLQNEIAKKTQEKSELMLDMGGLNDKFLEIDFKLKEVQNQLDQFNNSERANLQTQLDTQREKTTKLESGIEFLNKQISDYERQIERIHKEKKITLRKIAETEKEIVVFNEKEKNLQIELDRFTSQNQVVQNKILSKSQNDNLSASRVFELQEEVNVLQKDRSDLITQKALSEQNLERIEKEIIQIRAELENNLKELKLQENQNSQSKAQIMVERINAITSHLRRLKEEVKDTENEIKERTTQLYEYQHEASKLEMKRQVAEEQNWGRAIDKVLRSGIAGVHGVLAQLATVAPQYSLALEVAAGARLKSIVVEDDGVASQLIDFLKRQNAGRATFLPLNKIKVPNFEAPPQDTSGIVDWAINLVQCDEAYVSAFGYAFGSTLIVKDLMAGRRFLGRYRMVTLAGDLLEKSGAMTGGSSPRESGVHFGIEDNAKTEQLQKAIQNVQKRIQSLQSSLQELKNEVNLTESELDNLKSEWAKVKAAEEIQGSGFKALKDKTEVNKNRLSTLASEREYLQSHLQSLSSSLHLLERNLQKVSDNLAKEGLRVKDSGLENLINESQEIEFERKKTEIALKNLEAEKNELIKNTNSLQGGIERGDQEISEAHKQINILQTEVKQGQINIIAEKNLLKSLEDNFNELQKQIVALEKVKTELSGILLDLTEKKTQMSEAIKRLSSELADAKIKLLDLEERLSQLKQEVLKSEIEELTEWQQEYQNHNLSEQEVKTELEKVERKMTALEPVNMKAIDEYEEVFAKLNEIKERCEGLSKEREEIEKRINNYADHKRNSFFKAFDDVNKHFKEIFAELSFGQGELILENKEDPFKGGLIIQARPRNKKMQRLESMSGGEKSLTALSFIFALQWHNPAPFYAFDEVDMFLDGLNAERLAKMVKKQSSLAQFIVVSLRKPMIQASERAIGVCLGRDGFSKVAGMKSKEDVKNNNIPVNELEKIA